MNRIVTIALFSIAAGATFGQTNGSQRIDDSPIWEPIQLMKFDDVAPAPTVRKEMIASLKISDVTVPLEQDTKLEAMEQRFGGTIGERGDASESLGWLCLHGNDNVGPWVLWLESGEIDGPYIGGFEWARVPSSSQFDERCAALPDSGRVELPIELRPGVSEARVLQLLGRPTYRKGNVLVYEHEHDETIRGEPFTSDNSVYVAIKGGTVWAISVWKTTTD